MRQLHRTAGGAAGASVSDGAGGASSGGESGAGGVPSRSESDPGDASSGDESGAGGMPSRSESGPGGAPSGGESGAGGVSSASGAGGVPSRGESDVGGVGSRGDSGAGGALSTGRIRRWRRLVDGRTRRLPALVLEALLPEPPDGSDQHGRGESSDEVRQHHFSPSLRRSWTRGARQPSSGLRAGPCCGDEERARPPGSRPRAAVSPPVVAVEFASAKLQRDRKVAPPPPLGDPSTLRGAGASLEGAAPFCSADAYDQVSVPVLWPNASVSTPIFCSRVT